MALTLNYSFANFHTDCSKISQMEAVTMAQLPKEQGHISQDVTPVIGVIEDRDTDFLVDRLKFYAADFYSAISGWLDTDTPLTIDSSGVEFLFKEESVDTAKEPMMVQAVEKALQYAALSEWYARFPQRSDISQKYAQGYEALKGVARRLLFKKVERPYRFH